MVETALRLVDHGGFDVLTMRAVAEQLGVVPMALYRHVADKHDLVDAVLDLAIARVELPDADQPWRDGLTALARSVRATLLAHPGMIRPLLEEPRIGYNALTLRERLIAILRRGGFSGRDAERTTALVLTYTIGFVALEVPRRRAGYRPDGSAVTRIQAAFDLPADLFPNIVELASGGGEFVSDTQFDFGLRRLVDGLACLVEASAVDAPSLPLQHDDRPDDATPHSRHRRPGGTRRAR